MIEKLLGTGYYKFEGTIRDLKRLLKGFKVTEVVTDGFIQGINIYSAFAEFKFKKETYKMCITSDFSNENILHLEMKGKKKC